MVETETVSEKPLKAPKKCMYGAKCRNKKCKFQHPPNSSTVDAGAIPATQAANEAIPKATNNKPCRFGTRCTKKNCKFSHHLDVVPAHEQEGTFEGAPNPQVTNAPDPSPTGETATKKKKKEKKKNIPPPSAVTPDHSWEIEEPSNPEAAAQGTPDAETKPNQRPGSKSQANSKYANPCRFGARCNNSKCKFWHPKPAPEAPRVASPDIPLAADLEAALVQKASCKAQLQSGLPKQQAIPSSANRNPKKMQPQHSKPRAVHPQPRHLQPVKQSQPVNKTSQPPRKQAPQPPSQQQQQINIAAEINAAKTREQEQLAADEEFARQLQKEEQELDQLLREQERQRLADVEKLVKQQAATTKPPEKTQQPQQAKKKAEKKAAEKHQAKKAECLEQQRKAEELEAKRKAAMEYEKAIFEEAQKKKEEEERLRQKEEERARYKAERKAAKKARQRLEREANARLLQTSPTAESSGSNRENRDPERDAPIPKEVVHEEEQETEEEKKRRWQEELRLQKQRAAEKKEQQKEKRREQYLKEQESLQQETKNRANFWKEKIADEKRTVELLVKLCVADFCRLHNLFDQKSVQEDEDMNAKLRDDCQVAFRDLYKDSLPLRVAVKGLQKQQELNDRTGVIVRWDETKGKYEVELETKKGKQSQLMFFLPGNLDPLPNPVGKKGYKKRSSDPVHVVKIPNFYNGLDLTNDIYKNEVDRLKKAKSPDSFLASLMTERTEEERLEKEREEEERLKEEEARRRRQAKREKEQREWEEQQRMYEEFKAQQRESQKEARERSNQYDHSNQYNHKSRGGCNCPRCMFEEFLFARLFARMSGMGGGRGRGSFPGPDFPFFFVGGGFFDDDDEYDYYDDEDEWDRRWNYVHDEEEAEKDQEAADLLGVSVDATEAEIKRVFRRKALKYHPDKFKVDDNEDGMTREDAEHHFKELNNAVDRLMSKFD